MPVPELRSQSLTCYVPRRRAPAGSRSTPAVRVAVLAALLAVATAAPATASSFSSCDRALSDLPRGRMELADHIRTEPLRASETLGDETVIIAEEAARARFWPARRPSASGTRRTLRGLWRIRLARTISPLDLEVTHRLIGASGDGLSLDSSREVAMEAEVHALTPRVVCTNATDHIIEGDAELVFPLLDNPLAGRYRGTILTDVRIR